MKPGDLVRRNNFRRLPGVTRVLGVIVGTESHALTDRNGAVEHWWRVLWSGSGQLGFVLEEDLEVINASR